MLGRDRCAWRYQSKSLCQGFVGGGQERSPVFWVISVALGESLPLLDMLSQPVTRGCWPRRSEWLCNLK